jgi:type II secretory ATPase GspE/PulE/Tfp pilus assembly ATPase PilB-like protein
MNGKVADLIAKNASEAEITAAAQAQGMTTMLEDGLKKVKAGLTTLEEVLRVINQ